MRRRISPGNAFAFLALAASLSACAQTVVLEDQIADGGTSASGDGSSGCFGGQMQTLRFNTSSPEVIVALDRSSTMTAELPTALTALLAEVGYYQNVIRFGFVDFPDGLETCANTCCVGQLAMPPQMPMPMSYQTFQTVAYACNTTNPTCATASSRPTEAALRSCVAYYEGDLQQSGRFVLLMTDGEPGGGGEPGGSCGDAKGDCSDAENEVGMLHSFDVQTIILDLGAQSNANDCLHELATGQGPNGPYYYFPGANGLNEDLSTIGDMIASAACHLTLTTLPADTNQVSVTYYDAPIQRDPNIGWSFDKGNPLGITLNGTSCQTFITSRTYPQGLAVTAGCSTGHGGQTGP